MHFDPDSLFYSLSHFECNDHTIHMLTQQCLPPPLTNTVKSSLFTHAHSSPLSLAARLHQCWANHSHYITNGWTFSGQTSFRFLELFEFHLTNTFPDLSLQLNSSLYQPILTFIFGSTIKIFPNLTLGIVHSSYCHKKSQ